MKLSNFFIVNKNQDVVCKVFRILEVYYIYGEYKWHRLGILIQIVPKSLNWGWLGGRLQVEAGGPIGSQMAR